MAVVLLLTLSACDETAVPVVEAPTHEPEEERAPPIAEIDQLVGDVRWQAAGHGHWLAARAEQGLHESDSVQTMREAQALVRFQPGGASVRLEEETTLRIQPQPDQTTRLRHLSGRLVARLDPNTATRRIEVALPPGDLILEDTGGTDGGEPLEAQVNVEGDNTEISMVRGRGRMERERGASIDIDEATYVRLDAEGAIVEEGAEISAVEVLEPAAGATVRTRSETMFRWAAADAPRFVLRVEAEQGEPTELTTTQPNASIDLASGRYRWSVRAQTDAGLGRSSEPRALEVDLDRTPPQLSVTSPAPSSTQRGSSLVVTGRTEAGASVDVNGRAATVSEDGAFRVTVPVRRGLTNLVLRARDDLGNSRVVSRPVLVE